MKALVVLLACVLSAPAMRQAPASGSAEAPPRVRYVANSGMLVEVGGLRFLIDAPIREGIEPYATSRPDERSRLESASRPYDRIDAILVTHWHEDHFSPGAVAAHLSHDSRTVLVSSPEVVTRLRATEPTAPTARLRAVLPAQGASIAVAIGDARVYVIRLRHSPARRFPAEHVGFLIDAGHTVLHVGDADPDADNFLALAALPTPEVACLPFWYVSDARNREMTARIIRPLQVVAMHAPPADATQIARDLDDAPFPVVLAGQPGTDLRLRR